MKTTPNAAATVRTRDELVATYRSLSRSLANEALTEAEADTLRRQRDAVQAEIEAAVS